MRNLVKNCLRMRPTDHRRRGARARSLRPAAGDEHRPRRFDGNAPRQLPREAMARVEAMITMGGSSLPAKTIREMLVSSVDVIVQAARFAMVRAGSPTSRSARMEGDVVTTQDLFVYDILGEDEKGKIVGRHRSTGIGRPAFWDPRSLLTRRGRLAAASTRRR